MDDEYYLGIYHNEKNIDKTLSYIFSDDFISLYLVKKIEKNKYEIIKTIDSHNITPFSPRDIIYYNEFVQKYFIKFKNNNEIVLNFEIYVNLAENIGVYNRKINIILKDMLQMMANFENDDYDIIKDVITYFTEK